MNRSLALYCAVQMAAFMSRAQLAWPHVVIYTGGGYTDLLSYWPRCDYWWARGAYL